jgi:hypothetical protein
MKKLENPPKTQVALEAFGSLEEAHQTLDFLLQEGRALIGQISRDLQRRDLSLTQQQALEEIASAAEKEVFDLEKALRKDDE